MVAADILSVHNAIPIIMGANIGTSVTNTIVSHVHITDVEEFKRGFQGATVHDAFNFLTVLCLFPLEIVTSALFQSGGGVLFEVSDRIAEAVLNTDLPKW